MHSGFKNVGFFLICIGFQLSEDKKTVSCTRGSWKYLKTNQQMKTGHYNLELQISKEVKGGGMLGIGYTTSFFIFFLINGGLGSVISISIWRVVKDVLGKE